MKNIDLSIYLVEILLDKPCAAGARSTRISSPVEFSDYFRCVKKMCVFSVIVMSTGSDNLKEFLIGRSTARKVIESQEICDRPSNSTEGDGLPRNL